MRVCVVVGTRPEIIKMASVIHEIRARDRELVLVHTGQHYDASLSDVFFQELGLPAPDLNLEIGSGSQAQQTATALVRLEKAFLNAEPDLVLVEGDTNTVLATALAAAKIGLPVGHVEAGLRSYDRRMPEEHNRRLTDHLSSYLYAPTERAAETLREETVWGSIHVTGNTVIDACLRYAPLAEKNSTVRQRIPHDEYVLATVHRAENVDDAATLRDLLDILVECPVPVVYPVHPRTWGRIRSAGLEDRLTGAKHVTLMPPVGYFDFLVLLRGCRFVLTDSGGIQEEATAPNIQRKVFVLRASTERPEAVEAGYAEVVGTDPKRVLARVRAFLKGEHVPQLPSPYGDGRAGARIADLVDGIPARPHVGKRPTER